MNILIILITSIVILIITRIITIIFISVLMKNKSTKNESDVLSSNNTYYAVSFVYYVLYFVSFIFVVEGVVNYRGTITIFE
jgi:hypothetical protein